MANFANNSNLCAIDHLGREVVNYEQAGPEKEGKVIGLFYYLWHGYHGTQGPYDISKILEQDPDALAHPDSPLWPNPDHTPMLHWGEPMFGYYLSEDEWVLRRHVQMFIDAGVDVLFFDVTNGFTYRKVYLKLFNILSEMLKKGFAAPKVAFYTAPAIRGCGTGNMMDLWEQLYEPRLYPELYFYWKGKPLIICHSMRSLPDEIRDFFTWRSPTWKDPQEPNTWAWEGNPQKVAVDEFGNPEEIAVNVCRVAADPNSPGYKYSPPMSEAYWGVPVLGRSWHDGHKDERENASHYGFLFQEQAEFALKSNAPVAFICQWNEWLVPYLTRKTNTLYDMDHDILLQDEYNEEYSRDIEPAKGRYKDAYYLQMMSFIRRFKGMKKPVTESESNTIDVNGDFTQWDNIGITYREYTGDVEARNFRAYDAIGRYINETGRNEFAVIKVAADSDNVYFYARCSKKITPCTDKNWMTLFIKNRALSSSAWEGYQFAINRLNPTDGKLSVEACTDDGQFAWNEIGKINYKVDKKEMMLAIPKSILGIEDDNFTVEFKWTDNMQSNDVMDFYQYGDSAPRGRLNWMYKFEK